jgi:hypothetical protein
MKKPLLHLSALQVLLALSGLILLSPLSAQGPPLTQRDVEDTWSSVFYCQNLYREPEIKMRIYENDTQACRKSDSLVRWVISTRWSPADREILERNSMGKAGAIRYNTRSPQEAVTACRNRCRQLASIYDGKVASGEISANRGGTD